MTKQQTRSIQIPFCGFYESEASSMIDREIEDAFIDEDGECLGVPSEVWGGNKDYWISHKQIEIELVKAYVDAFADQFEDETGVALKASFEEMTSPREYNFETDRVFATVPLSVVRKLFAESKKDKHAHLKGVIKKRCTSYDGFHSYYDNDLAAWLAKPVADWDHNELHILLEAVLEIHNVNWRHFDVYDLLERWTCNGGLSNAVWGAMPEKLRQFAELQREYGKAIDFALFAETGKAFEDGADRDELELPPLPCDKTLSLFPELRGY